LIARLKAMAAQRKGRHLSPAARAKLIARLRAARGHRGGTNHPHQRFTVRHGGHHLTHHAERVHRRVQQRYRMKTSTSRYRIVRGPKTSHQVQRYHMRRLTQRRRF
jgi:hypothetical protein